MKSRWDCIVPTVASAALAASLSLVGCTRPASEPTAPATPPGAPQSPAVAPAAGTRTAVLAVKGMTWAGWAGAVRSALVKVDGVQSADVSFDTKEATVVYDPAKTKPEQLVQAVEQAQGMAPFSATVKEA